LDAFGIGRLLQPTPALKERKVAPRCGAGWRLFGVHALWGHLSRLGVRHLSGKDLSARRWHTFGTNGHLYVKTGLQIEGPQIT